MKKTLSQNIFFFGIVSIVGLIMIYSFSSSNAQEDYLKELKEFREKKDKMFKTSEESPLDKKEKKEFKGLSYYEPNLNFKIEAHLERFVLKETIKINTSTNTPRTYLKYAKVKFNINEQPFELVLLKPVKGLDNILSNQLLFLPFTDETSGRETYGAGRYLDFEEPKGDKIMLDFNYAYNPYCAYNSVYDCPVPPAENHLPIPILAGEKNYQSHYKK
ncbi:MAG: DUF1684 domain-containing protein [Flammeovirgaceae bacterium]